MDSLFGNSPDKENAMDRALSMLTGVGLGAGLMYLLDPQMGRRRRALLGGKRALLTGLGAGLFLYGLTRRAPAACLLGTVGCALAAEGLTSASFDDIARVAGSSDEEESGNWDEPVATGF
jgi:hypothetical protein